MRRPELARRVLVLAAISTLTAACGDPATGTGGTVPSQLSTSASPSFVACPTSETHSATGTILPRLGGVVSAGGTLISLPAGAVLQPTEITVTVPASDIMEVRITANGREHLLFELPVQVTIDYGRCSRTATDDASLSVWYIDESSRALLEPMGGIDDKLTRSITFTTGHLSGYAIVN